MPMQYQSCTEYAESIEKSSLSQFFSHQVGVFRYLVLISCPKSNCNQKKKHIGGAGASNFTLKIFLNNDLSDCLLTCYLKAEMLNSSNAISETYVSIIVKFHN